MICCYKCRNPNCKAKTEIIRCGKTMWTQEICPVCKHAMKLLEPKRRILKG